ncbi:hypothetical protein V6N11_005309 [Hibiscus sabdariffa]|uniref:C2H2-type domain-containing protein n=1 Tax=Hibiscus sabdariffa TaxID=183260 RepID=A0ABR2RME8_9ROSI
MSNLTSASGKASVSSGNRTEVGSHFPQQFFATPPPQPQPVKKKRSLPGNPDPDAQVIALSPKTLMATNRFMCEICGKGFQRDQNLQLHRRGHSLPWKLKQRTSKEVRKKVYVCPEASCVHHEPSRALGDLTGIKKHFFRKHGEKKWKCEKCCKKYAVQSDWKAHSKTCGTREYRCDCGTIFSRRDSFITHRAFCDALAEESGAAPAPAPAQAQQREFSLKNEQQSLTSLRAEIPPWLVTPTLDQYHENHNPSPTLPPFHPSTVPSPHMSATALLQKAAQMGATMSSKTGSSSAPATTAMRSHHHQQTHVSLDSGSNNNTTIAGFGLDLRNSFDSTCLDDIAFSGIFNTKGGGSFVDESFSKTTTPTETTTTTGLTRDFLGLRPISRSHILNIAGLSNFIHDQQHNQSQKPPHG